MNLPVVVQTASMGVRSVDDLVRWVGERRDAMRADIVRHGALLVRGLPGLGGPETFGRIARALVPTLRNYVEGQSRRQEVAPQIYNSTYHPANERITLHHELSYAPEPPLWIFFGCALAAASGGATPLLDCRWFLASLPADVRAAFEGRGILYVKNMPGGRGVGKSWQEHYETEDRAVVDAYLERSGTEHEWTERGGLRIRRVMPAISPHPDTGELVWFNQASLWHVSNLGEAGRAFQDLLGERNLPTHAFFDNGDPIPDALIERVRCLMWERATSVPWQEGDVLLVDNRSVAHGRQPYGGDRLLYVAMA